MLHKYQEKIKPLRRGLGMRIEEVKPMQPVSAAQVDKMRSIAAQLFNKPALIGDATLLLAKHTGKDYKSAEKGLEIMQEREIIERYGNVIKLA